MKNNSEKQSLKDKLLEIKDLIMNSNSDNVDKEKNKYYDKFITIPNIISLARILGSIGICTWIGFNGVTSPYLLGGLIAGVAATDFVDGFIARKFNMQSKWGKRLDPIADKGLGIGLSIILCAQGLMNPLPTILIASRDIAAVSLFVKKKGQISVNNYGRAKMVLQSLGILSTVMFGYGASSVLSMLGPICMWSAVATAIPEAIKVKKDYFPSSKEDNLEDKTTFEFNDEDDIEIVKSECKTKTLVSCSCVNQNEYLYSTEAFKQRSQQAKVLRKTMYKN